MRVRVRDMRCSSTHSLTHSRLAVAGLLSCSMAMGQVNVTSDVVTFRDATRKDKTTTHNGIFNVNALSAGGGKGLQVGNEATATGGAWGTYGMHAWSTASTNGIAGRFDGRNRGVVGIATVAGSEIHYGGYFEGTSSSAVNYGVWAKGTGGTSAYGGYFEASGGANNYAVYAQGFGGSWAGYFSGNIRCTGAYNPSDARFKTAAEPMRGSLQKIMRLSPQTYFYDTLTNAKMNFPSGRQYGLIAQQVEEVFPDIVREAVDAPDPSADSTAIKSLAATQTPYKCVNYTALVPILVAAMQEQQAQIEAQRLEIEALKATVSAMKGK